jgi:hypothetical protein
MNKHISHNSHCNADHNCNCCPPVITVNPADNIKILNYIMSDSTQTFFGKIYYDIEKDMLFFQNRNNEIFPLFSKGRMTGPITFGNSDSFSNLQFVGEWQINKKYFCNNIVKFNNSYWISKMNIAMSVRNPSSDNNWAIVLPCLSDLIMNKSDQEINKEFQPKIFNDTSAIDNIISTKNSYDSKISKLSKYSSDNIFSEQTSLAKSNKMAKNKGKKSSNNKSESFQRRSSEINSSEFKKSSQKKYNSDSNESNQNESDNESNQNESDNESNQNESDNESNQNESDNELDQIELSKHESDTDESNNESDDYKSESENKSSKEKLDYSENTKSNNKLSSVYSEYTKKKLLSSSIINKNSDNIKKSYDTESNSTPKSYDTETKFENTSALINSVEDFLEAIGKNPLDSASMSLDEVVSHNSASKSNTPQTSMNELSDISKILDMPTESILNDKMFKQSDEKLFKQSDEKLFKQSDEKLFKRSPNSSLTNSCVTKTNTETKTKSSDNNDYIKFWNLNRLYDVDNVVMKNNKIYRCSKTHKSSEQNAPGKGKFWKLININTIKKKNSVFYGIMIGNDDKYTLDPKTKTTISNDSGYNKGINTDESKKTNSDMVSVVDNVESNPSDSDAFDKVQYEIQMSDCSDRKLKKFSKFRIPINFISKNDLQKYDYVECTKNIFILEEGCYRITYNIAFEGNFDKIISYIDMNVDNNESDSNKIMASIRSHKVDQDDINHINHSFFLPISEDNNHRIDLMCDIISKSKKRTQKITFIPINTWIAIEAVD